MEEVNPDSGTAQRSQTTGHLVITLPRSGDLIAPKNNKPKSKVIKQKVKENEVLEIKDGNHENDLDFGNIVKHDDDLDEPPPLEEIPVD